MCTKKSTAALMPRAIATASDALSIERPARSAARFERPAKQALALATKPRAKRETRSVQGFIQDFSSEGGNYSVRQYTQTRGVWGHAPPGKF